MIETCKVLSGKRITIPKKLAEKYNIKVGDIVTVQDNVIALEIRLCDVIPKETKK